VNINHLIANAQNMPNIPKLVQELIQGFNDDHINSEYIAQKLSKDQAMTARVLRMANSVRYGGHRQVGSIGEAVVLLGFNALRTLVLSSGIAGAFTLPKGFDIKSFWLRSFTAASISKWLANVASDIDADVAYTAGMLNDVGGLLIHILVPDEAKVIQERIIAGEDRWLVEEEILGFTAPDAGAELASRWKFPDEIVDSIRYQCVPDTEDGYKSLAGVVHLATYFYDNQAMDKEGLLANCPVGHVEKLGINPATLADCIEEIKEMESGMEDILD